MHFDEIDSDDLSIIWMIAYVIGTLCALNRRYTFQPVDEGSLVKLSHECYYFEREEEPTVSG